MSFGTQVYIDLGVYPRDPLADTTPRPPHLEVPDVARAIIKFAELVLAPFVAAEAEMLAAARLLLDAPRGNLANQGNLRYARQATRSTLVSLAFDAARRSKINRASVKLAANTAARVGATLVSARPAADKLAIATGVIEEVYRLEAAALLREHAAPDADRVHHVLYRSEGRKDRLGQCVVRLDDGTYATVAKGKGRYVCVIGSRTEALATIHTDIEATLDFILARETALGLSIH